MPTYSQIQLIAYGSVTSEPTQVLPDDAVNAYKEDAEIRASVFSVAAEWTREQFADRIGGADTLKVFIAPEFFFRYGGPSQPTDALRDSYPDGELLLPNLIDDLMRGPKRLGRPEFADWLFVPGTMFWHKPADGRCSNHPLYFNTVPVFRGGPRVELSGPSKANNDNPGTIPVVGTTTTNQKQLMSGIDYSFGPVGRVRSRWDATLNPMFESVLGDWDWWRYHIFTVQDIEGPTGNPLVFGVEVCLEHIAEASHPNSGLGVLRTLTTPGQGYWDAPPEIDLHLLTSCGMTIDAQRGVAARTGGYVLHCDGMQPGVPSWPVAGFGRVVNVDANTQARDLAPVLTGGAVRVLPDAIQIGRREGVAPPHHPLDSVAVWNPTPL